MAAAIKYVEKALTVAAGGAWAFFSSANRIAQRRAFTPAWSDLPLLKSHERTKPPLGWPRETDPRARASSASPTPAESPCPSDPDVVSTAGVFRRSGCPCRMLPARRNVRRCPGSKNPRRASAA